MSSIVNKVKEALHSDKDKTHTEGTHTTHTTHTAGLTGDNRGVDGPATRTDGPHTSNVANKADPRVDSDRDHSRNLGANPHGTATTGHTTTAGYGTATHGTTTSTNAGPHDSNLANKADPRIDSDLDGSRAVGSSTHGTTTTGHVGHTTGHTGHAGHAGHYAAGAGSGAGIGAGLGAAGAQQHAAHTQSTSTNAGPHDSNLANKLDPRVDSDLNGSRTLGSNPQGTSTVHKDHPGHTTHGHHNTSGLATGAAVGAGAGVAGHHAATHGHHGTHHTEANRGFDGPASKTDGPHTSNVANKADPRVDSDRDHSRNLGANPHGTATTGTTTHGTTYGTTHGTTGSAGDAFFSGNDNVSQSTYGNTGLPQTHDAAGNHPVHGTTGTLGGAPEGTYGTHNSRAANAADPRIDSDLDGSRNAGISTGTHTGAHTGTHHGTHTGTHGTHTGAHAGTTGAIGGTRAPGPAPNTAGPHTNDTLNKLDPRVDSDLDGSKTVGGDKTYSQSNVPLEHRDPTDAAQVPPSVLQKHVGGVQVAHDDHTHDRERRHSVSHQENHRGL